MLRWSRKGLVAVFLVLLVLAAGHGDYRPTTLDLAVGPHKYGLVRWELSHFLDKWTHKLADLMPWNSEPSRQERIEIVQEFFAQGDRMRELERQLLFPDAGDEVTASEGDVRASRVYVAALQVRREGVQALVEETIEAEISAVLSQEGFASRIGLIFPPVDTVFTRPPGVLILSPRDRIHRQRTILMKPGLSDASKDRIEEVIFKNENLSALVESTGGVAAFPSVVSESGGLHQALVTAAHEWLHHWFFFQPLGQHFGDSSQMTTLNETAATLGGRAIGDRVYAAMTGEQVAVEPEPPVATDPGDFDSAMQETRLRTEELLAQGQIEEAEAYMEERRQLMAANGHFIRKINQAFFAFRESYATNPASLSPISDQLKVLQDRSDSLEDFIKTVARFASYQELLDHLGESRGRVPATTRRN